MTEPQNPTPIALENVSFAVVDLETTGIDPTTDRIVQMAAIIVDGTGKVVDTFDTIVKPESPEQYIHAAEHIHGISKSQVANGMPLREALVRLRQMSDGKVFTAHNAQFDIGFIHAESQRVGFDMTVHTFVDTLQLARRTDTERTRKHTLDALCTHYGIERERAHEAKSDATATAELLFHLMQEMNITSVDQLDDLLS
jgi:DNA polymerase III epsilon subunit family exonuclease